MSNQYDWSRFKRSIFIQASREQVFDAWIIPKQVGTWFLEEANFYDAVGNQRDPLEPIQQGDEYTWKWWNYGTRESGVITSLESQNYHLEFSFASDLCRVTVDVEDREGDTLLRLEQTGIPLDEQHKRDLHLGCSSGWSFWMVNLKSWLEHGIVLHDETSRHPTEEFEFCELINR